MTLSSDFIQYIDQSTDAIIIADTKGNIMHTNHKCCSLFNYPIDELIGKPISVLMPHSYRGKHEAGMKKHNETGKNSVIGSVVELEAIKSDGNVFPIQLSLSKIKINDTTMFSGIITDISQRKLLENNLKLKLEERETLLKEIHHRVKNNLQIISSIVSLQSNKTDNIEIKEFVKDFSARVFSIALVHEKIYSSNDISKLKFGSYVVDLVQKLKHIFEIDVNFKIDIDDHDIRIDNLIPLGLIIIEISTNSIKHAFDPEVYKEIVISARKHNDYLHLKITDNGNGYKKHHTTGLGTKLIKSLSKQLKAEIVNHSAAGGTSYEFKIPTQSN